MKSFATAFLYFFAVLAQAGSSNRPPTGDEIAVITNWGADSVSIVNVKSGKELSQIKVCAKPYDVKISDKGDIAYVTCSGDSYISKIDLVANLERKDEKILVGLAPRDIEITSDGTRAVVANSGSDDISVVDLATRKELYRVRVGPIPYGVGLTNGDKTAIITLWGSGKAVFVSLGATSGSVQSTIDVGALPYTVYPSRNGHYALVTCFGDESVHILDVKAQKLHTRLKVGRSPWGLAVSPDGKTAIVANFYDGDASILEIADIAPDPLGAGTAPVKEVARIKLVKPDPLGAETAARRAKNAAFSGDSRFALMSDLAKNQVMLIDVQTKEVVRTIDVGQAPYGIAFAPNRK